MSTLRPARWAHFLIPDQECLAPVASVGRTSDGYGESVSGTAEHAVHRWSPADLSPGYFAGVMGTGIVSIGARLTGHDALASILLWCAVGFYLVLVALNVWRIVAHRGRVFADLSDAGRAFGFFTFIAATDVISTALLNTSFAPAVIVLLGVSVVTWLVLGYVIPWLAMLGSGRRSTLDSANGSWFVWVVASQSIAVVSSGLAAVYPTLLSTLSMIAVMAWAIGIVLYIACAILVTLRVMLYGLKPADLDPSYWVTMGALAITVVAGSRILEMQDAPMVDVTRGLIAGVSVIFWSFATWLVPVLIAAGVWRHRHHRVPLHYEPGLWSVVFPVGMYSVASISIGDADALPFVESIGQAWFWVSLAVWAAVGIAMIMHLARRFVRR